MNTSSKISTVKKGRLGEALVALQLEKEGYEIFKQNWRTPYGEVDLVATKNNCLTIFEIKTRLKFGNIGDDLSGRSSTIKQIEKPLISWKQRQRLARAALWIWQRERKNFGSVKCKLLLVTQREIKICNLPLLYDAT